MHDCLIAFGSNEGNREETFVAAIRKLNQTKDLRVAANSQPLLTAAVGGPEKQAGYLNGVIRVESSLEPAELHQRIVEIENELGRIRRTRWGARTIDLDLLLFGQQQIKTEDLIVPHPRMSFRRFVLEPACEIASDMIHPPSSQTLGQLVDRLNFKNNLMLFACPHPIAESLTAMLEEVKKIQGSEREPEWELKLINQLDQFRKFQHQSKLAMYFHQPDTDALATINPDDAFEQVRMAAISFPGPSLELPRDVPSAKVEILAAIQAMAPLQSTQRAMKPTSVNPTGDGKRAKE